MTALSWEFREHHRQPLTLSLEDRSYFHMERQRISGEMNRGRNGHGQRWRHSGTRSISLWLRYTSVNRDEAERASLGLEVVGVCFVFLFCFILFTGSGEAMNIRALEPGSSLQGLEPHTQRVTSIFMIPLQVRTGSRSPAPGPLTVCGYFTSRTEP